MRFQAAERLLSPARTAAQPRHLKIVAAGDLGLFVLRRLLSTAPIPMTRRCRTDWSALDAVIWRREDLKVAAGYHVIRFEPDAERSTWDVIVCDEHKNILSPDRPPTGADQNTVLEIVKRNRAMSA
jgi:hypothetical protein